MDGRFSAQCSLSIAALWRALPPICMPHQQSGAVQARPKARKHSQARAIRKKSVKKRKRKKEKKKKRKKEKKDKQIRNYLRADAYTFAGGKAWNGLEGLERLGKAWNGLGGLGRAWEGLERHAGSWKVLEGLGWSWMVLDGLGTA